MTFDNFWHADAGNIFTLLGMIMSLYLFHIANVRRITRMEFKVGLMWRRFAQRFNINADLNDYNEGDGDRNFHKDDF